MLHVRDWLLKKADDACEAAKLIKSYQNECFGVQIGDVALINDSTDVGIREYAVIDLNRDIQIDSWTTDWMSEDEIISSIEEILIEAHTYDAFLSFSPFDPSMISMA